MAEQPSNFTPKKRRWLRALLVCAVVLAVVAVLVVQWGLPAVHQLLGIHNVYYMMGWLPLHRYAEDHVGFFPPLSPEPGRLMYPPDALYPQYANSLHAWTYPGTERPDQLDENGELNLDALINDHSYFYLGYAITNDTEARAFANAYKERIASGQGFEDDLKVREGQGNAYGDTIHRLRENVDEIIAEKQSPGDPSLVASSLRIPIYIQRLGQCGPDKANVQFLDGHTETIPYPGEFPMTPEVIAVLEELDALGE
jgi:prepilin-type processing-associated H-X9-DG protein